jgi:hypothetical protein
LEAKQFFGGSVGIKFAALGKPWCDHFQFDLLLGPGTPEGSQPHRVQVSLILVEVSGLDVACLGYKNVISARYGPVYKREWTGWKSLLELPA